MGYSVKKISFDEAYLYLTINGVKNRISLPSLSMRLFKADKATRENLRVSSEGFTIYWPKLDLELQMTGLLQMCQKCF